MLDGPGQVGPGEGEEGVREGRPGQRVGIFWSPFNRRKGAQGNEGGFETKPFIVVKAGFQPTLPLWFNGGSNRTPFGLEGRVERKPFWFEGVAKRAPSFWLQKLLKPKPFWFKGLKM